MLDTVLLLGWSLLLLAGLWPFLTRRHFVFRALGFLALTLAGFAFLAHVVPEEGWSGLLLLAGLGLPVSLALALLCVFLARRLEKLTATSDPDLGEGRND